MLNHETIKDLIISNSIMSNNYLKNKKDSIQFNNDNIRRPENFKRNYCFISIDENSDPYDIIKEITNKENLRIYTINNKTDFSDYMNQDTIVLNVPDEIDSDIFNCICKFINLKNSELDYLKTDLILSSYFENFVIISLNKFEDLKCPISKKFLGFLKAKVQIYDKIGVNEPENNIMNENIKKETKNENKKETKKETKNGNVIAENDSIKTKIENRIMQLVEKVDNKKNNELSKNLTSNEKIIKENKKRIIDKH